MYKYILQIPCEQCSLFSLQCYLYSNFPSHANKIYHLCPLIHRSHTAPCMKPVSRIILSFHYKDWIGLPVNIRKLTNKDTFKDALKK